MAETFRYTYRVRGTALLGALSFGIVVPTFFIPMELGSKAHFLSIMVATLTTYVIWEGSKFIQALVLYLYPWEKSIGKHLVYEVAGIFVFSSLMLIIGILTYSSAVSSVYITVAVVLKNRRASISLVQRHLRIGYNRAARLLEQMEQSGLVSTMQSNGNREIMVPAGNTE